MQADLGHRGSHILKDTFSHGAALNLNGVTYKNIVAMQLLSKLSRMVSFKLVAHKPQIASKKSIACQSIDPMQHFSNIALAASQFWRSRLKDLPCIIIAAILDVSSSYVSQT